MITARKTIDFTSTVSEIVRSNYRTADVMKKYGINYCCGGEVSLAEACLDKHIDQRLLAEELEDCLVTIALSPNTRFDQWPVDFLIDYILNVHHAYTRQVLPKIAANLLSFVDGHRKKYPYLDTVLMAYEDLHQELEIHMDKEENTIFPYLKIISNAYKRKEVYGGLFVKTMSKSLDQMIVTEHNRILALMCELRRQTKNYQFPEKACTNHQVIYNQLMELDQDLVQHKHLENKLLFPRIIQMEKELLQY